MNLLCYTLAKKIKNDSSLTDNLKYFIIPIVYLDPSVIAILFISFLSDYYLK